MSPDHEEILEQDWARLWDTLPEAPPLVARPASAQITLRLPAGLRGRIRRVADARGLAYHALARSWLIDGVREQRELEPPATLASQPEQMNLKVDPELLDALKHRAHEAGRPYHALARELIEATLASEEARLHFNVPASEPPIKELMVLMLHARNARGQDAVKGITRMQKLLFVLEQTLAPQAHRFAPNNYGPFSEGVNDAADALRLAGFLSHGAPAQKGPPSYAEMIAGASAPPASERQAGEEFALSEAGHDAAERLRHSNHAYEQLYDAVSRLRAEWDTPDLIERVYESWPEQTERSLIRDDVAERRRRRRSR
jgi:predicted DNA binding CopG/RHH family protein